MILKRLVITISLCCVSLFSRNDPIPIALCLKVNGEVQRKGNIRTGLIRKGDYIYHGDKLITNDIGFVSIMMIYERTIIKLYDNSVARLLFDVKRKSDNTELGLFEGKVIIEMGKDCDHYITLTTPSATAKVTKTDFLAEYQNENLFDELRYAIFTSLNGTMEIENTYSNESLHLFKGETVVSTLNGDFLKLDTFKSGIGIVSSLMEFR